MLQSDLSIALKSFQDSLTPEQAARFTASLSTSPDVDDVLHLTNEINENNSNRKSRVFADRVQGLLSSVQQYCSVIDTWAGPNQISALIWGTIKLFILVTSNFTEYFEKLSKRVAQLSIHYPRLAEYEKLFLSSLRLQNALSNLYAVIVIFCSKALRVIQEKGTKRFSKSLWKTFKLEFAEIEENLAAAKVEVKEEINLASRQAAHNIRHLQMIEFEENRLHRYEQAYEVQANQSFRSQQTLALQQTKERQIQKIVQQEERRRIRLLQSIPNYDYTATLHRSQAQRCQNTCLWLLKRTEFIEWIDQIGPKHLCCYGIPGCGKTVLMGYVIDYLAVTYSSKQDTAIIYYFFDYTAKESLRMSTFLRCILHQVIRPEKLDPSILLRLESLFLGQMDQTVLNITELKDIFVKFYRSFKIGLLLIDGLDEVDVNDQRCVKEFLMTIQYMSCAKLFITTHPELDVSKVLRNTEILRIDPKYLKTDIETFIDVKFKEHSQGELRICQPDHLSKIKEFLLSCADGMFLWVDLQIKTICDACEDDGTPDRIPDLLMSLPKELVDIYSRALDKLSHNDRQSERARRVFYWVLKARRPMTIPELEEAISITTSQKSWKRPPVMLDPSKISKLCANLINYEESTRTVSLAHHTVLLFLSSYFEESRKIGFVIEDHKAEQSLAETCITYLSFVDFQKAVIPTIDTRYAETLNQPANLLKVDFPSITRISRTLLGSGSQFGKRGHDFDIVDTIRSELSMHQSKLKDPSFQLLEYCKTHWHDHSRWLICQKQEVSEVLKTFVLQTNKSPDWKPWNNIPNKKRLSYWNIFFWAVREGHSAIFQIWQSIILTEEITYWKQLWLEDGPTFFASACTVAHAEQLDIMLYAKKTLSTERPSSNELSLGLTNACRLGHIEIVEQLLQEKAGVNVVAADYYGKTALQAAAKGGHLAVVERLLQEKADVNTAAVADYGGRTALQAAAEGGHLAVVERLLQEKADVNAAAVRDNGRTALQAAAEGGHLVIVERLLQKKADVNTAAARYNGKIALQAAAEGGHLAVVERLLQKKADVNAAAVRDNGRTALQAAAEGGHLAVVERLFQEKADVNAAAAVDYNGRTALQAAAEGGHLAVVERLLQEKADVNAAAAKNNGRTALQAAAEGGHLAVVERLLQEKADVNAAAAKNNGRTALQAAAEGGHLAVVERLFQEKADVNAAAADYGGRTALQAAAEGGHLAVVERLLQEKADVNAVASYDGRTALQAAAKGGHLAIIERLLQEKADVNAAAAADYNGRTALQAAAEGGHLAVVERLLQEKADVNTAAAADYGGRTALQAAAEGGHLAVVERLLQEKADVNAVASYDGRTALQAAAKGGHLAVVERLRIAGAR